MLRIVFINPSVDKYARIKLWSSELLNKIKGKPVAVMPKMAPMILAAVTPPEHEFIFIDEEIDDVNYDEINADIVALTAMTVQVDRAYEIAGEFRKKGVTVVIGGIHATVMPEEASRHFDAVAIGEGENIWPEILKDFENGNLKKFYNAKDYPPAMKMVSPKIDIIKHEQYSVFPLQATKGCPYDCDFCSVSFINGRNIRLKPVAQVLAEIAGYERYNKTFIKRRYQFVDDNLYVNRAYTKELLTALKSTGINWHGQGTLNTLMDDEILNLLAESGCRVFSIGFESINEKSLVEAKKTKTNKVEMYGQAVANLIKRGITPGGFFIFGFDNDDKDVFSKTVEFIEKNHIVNPTFCILTPFPGTQLAKRINDRVFNSEWKDYGILKCVFKPKNMTADELEKGLYRASAELAGLDSIRRQFKYFWAQGPWLNNPVLRLPERAVLILFSLLLIRRSKSISSFIFWAATRKNAVDFFMIMTAVVFNDMTARYMSG